MKVSRPTGDEGTEKRDRELSKSRGMSEGDFDQLVQAHREEILRFALRMTRSEEDALDVFQDTFFRAYTGLQELAPDSNVRAWLYRIAANVCKDRHRELARATRTYEKLQSQSLKPKDPEKLLLDQELRGEIRRIVEALPFRQKTVFVLRHFEGLSHREIAEILDCSEESSRTNLSLAIGKLREMLRAYLI